MSNIKDLTHKVIKGYKKQAESNNYMFWQNLNMVVHAAQEMLNMDEEEVDRKLSDGNGWALDHIATSTDDIEEVYHFLEDNKKAKISAHNFDPYKFMNPMKDLISEINRISNMISKQSNTLTKIDFIERILEDLSRDIRKGVLSIIPREVKEAQRILKEHKESLQSLKTRIEYEIKSQTTEGNLPIETGLETIYKEYF